MQHVTFRLLFHPLFSNNMLNSCFLCVQIFLSIFCEIIKSFLNNPLQNSCKAVDMIFVRIFAALRLRFVANLSNSGLTNFCTKPQNVQQKLTESDIFHGPGCFVALGTNFCAKVVVQPTCASGLAELRSPGTLFFPIFFILWSSFDRLVFAAIELEASIVPADNTILGGKFQLFSDTPN